MKDATASLLWAACRPAPDEAACESARELGADLESASQAAVRHRVSPLLWRVAQRWATDRENWSESLRNDAARCKAQAVLVRPRLASELLEPLAAAGLQPLVIKGTALAERYPGPGLRPMDDVDVIAPPGAHADVLEVLRRGGWSATRRQGPPYSVSLCHPAMPGLPVDLHQGLAIRAEEVFRLTVEDLWAARRQTTLFGAPAYGLAPENELLLLATHAGKPFHNFDRMLWAVDAAVIIVDAVSRGAAIDWEHLSGIARRAAALSALAVVLTQAERLGAESPQSLRDVPAGTARRRTLERPLGPTWPLEDLDLAERRRLLFAVIDDPWLRLRHLMYESAEDGVARAPLKAAVMAGRIVRRLWRLRLNGTGEASERRGEQVDPVVADREA